MPDLTPCERASGRDVKLCRRPVSLKEGRKQDVIVTCLGPQFDTKQTQNVCLTADYRNVISYMAE